MIAVLRNLALPVAALCLLLAGCARPTGEFPTREVKLIVQASPGGLSDTISRITASLMENQLGAPVVCENRPGASGALAFSYVARQPADGYTIGHAPVEIALVRTMGFADVGPDNMDLLCLVAKTPPALAVPADSAWKSLPHFLEAVRARPGYYVIGNSGTGAIWHVNAMLLERHARIQVIHCPFSGGAAALTALLGGHVDAVVAGVSEILPHVRSGRLRLLSVFDQERSRFLPDIPTAREEGYDFGAPAWSGFFGPRGMDPATRRTLAEAVSAAYRTEEFQKMCEERGIEPILLETDEFHEFATSQADYFARMIPSLLRESR